MSDNRLIEARGNALKLAGKRILVVDDEYPARALLLLILQPLQLEIVEAESVEEALEVLDSSSVDLLISDLGLPGQDGFELIAIVRARSSSNRLPAIAISGRAQPADRARALNAGFDLHMGKPFDAASLLDALVALLQP